MRNVPLHVKSGLVYRIMLALNDCFKTFDRLLARDVGTLLSGKDLSDEKRLREKLLNLARAVHERLVLFRKFLNPEDGDDVLEILVPLEDAFYLIRDPVVLLAHDVRR